ncbi:zinc-dependent metalloprotease, partial [Synechococcus sp. CCY 9618]|uniref:zinc-dependent metalloprotease n=1 Tax=Synechococcus sp. CCY 9618 TaxID=2815602 RepID=UPI001C23777A
MALVFNRGDYSAAATASHEVGHTLGLTHDGAGSTEYYAGHGGTGPTSWGTILGAPYLGDDENLTQWSKGEYYGANNSQDDLAVITG